MAGASAGELPPSRPADAMAEIAACIKEVAALDPFLASTPPAITFPGFTAEDYVLEEGSTAEAVTLASLRRVTKVVALFIASWCGMEEG